MCGWGGDLTNDCLQQCRLVLGVIHNKKLLKGCEVDKEHEDLTLGVVTSLGALKARLMREPQKIRVDWSFSLNYLILL